MPWPHSKTHCGLKVCFAPFFSPPKQPQQTRRCQSCFGNIHSLSLSLLDLLFPAFDPSLHRFKRHPFFFWGATRQGCHRDDTRRRGRRVTLMTNPQLAHVLVRTKREKKKHPVFILALPVNDWSRWWAFFPGMCLGCRHIQLLGDTLTASWLAHKSYNHWLRSNMSRPQIVMLTWTY